MADRSQRARWTNTERSLPPPFAAAEKCAQRIHCQRIQGYDLEEARTTPNMKPYSPQTGVTMIEIS